jgi:hypothetical protein
MLMCLKQMLNEAMQVADVIKLKTSPAEFLVKKMFSRARAREAE